MSGFRGRGSRGSRSRGGGPRGGFRGRGSYSDYRGRGGYRGYGDGFSRGRGGPPRHLSREDDTPPRKIPMSRAFDSDRERGPPVDKGRRGNRYDDEYDRAPRSRSPISSRDLYSSPPRESSRMLDRLTPPRSSMRDRDFGATAREFIIAPRLTLSGESGSYRESYTTSLREERREHAGRPRDFPPSRSGGDYLSERDSRDFRDSSRDYGSRDYPPPRSSDFKEPMRRDISPRDRSSQHDHDYDDYIPRGGGRGGHMSKRGGGYIDSRDHSHSGEREFTSSRFSRLDDRDTGRGPPREYSSRGGRGGIRGGSRDDRGGYMGSRGRGGPPRGRGRPDYSGSRGGRRSPSGFHSKRPRMDDEGDSYSGRR